VEPGIFQVHGPRCRHTTAWTQVPWPFASLSRLVRDNGPFLSLKIGSFVQVLVRENNVDQALRVLKKKMQREGVFREMKQRRSYEKPSERRIREKAEALRRARKLARKQAQREGLLPMPKRKVPARPARPGALPSAMSR
jgi:small subunit ribosomal protein S21